MPKKTRDPVSVFSHVLSYYFFFRKKKEERKKKERKRERKRNYKLTVAATLACSVPRPSLVSKGNLERMLGGQGSRADSRPGVSSLFLAAETGLQEQGQLFSHLRRPVEKAEIRGD